MALLPLLLAFSCSIHQGQVPLLGFRDTSLVFPTHPCSQTAAAPFLLEGRSGEEEIELLALPLLSTIFLEGSFSLVAGLHCPPHSCLFL